MPTPWCAVLVTVAVALTGCSHYNNIRDYRGRPKFRKGFVACESFPNKFVEPDRLGKHRYHYSLRERSGIVYTTQAGHVDIAHLRKSADWTAYLAGMSLKRIKQGERQWTFHLREPSRYLVTLQYPSDWSTRADREEIAEEVAICLGEYFAYEATVWHEILTWFGYKTTHAIPEFASSFSWEDNFSNLLGTLLAGQALRDQTRPYDEAMTVALLKELSILNAQPMKVAKRVAKAMKGKWYVTAFPIFMDVIMRNLDIGEDGSVRSLTYEGPGIAIAVPGKSWEAYGFKLKMEILPTGYQCRGVRKLLAKKRVSPDEDFKTLMDFIEREARRRGYDVIR